MGRSIKHRFSEVAISAEKQVSCTKCKKRLKRRKRFYQTLNPFNKNKAGYPKSREEIFAELNKEAAIWKVTPETCQACQE